MTMQVKRADQRYLLEADWLSAYWLFSFGHYYDPANLSFGPLRVFNHDTIAGRAGFPPHSHAEMEIVTYVLAGALQHQDSTGGAGVIGAGEVQRMTAGTGITHSEMNAHPSESTRLLQIWLHPATAGLPPGYEQKQFTQADRSGTFLPIVSGHGLPGALHIHQDATFYVAQLQAGQPLELPVKLGRRAFFYVIEGTLQLQEETLRAGDQVRIQVVTEPLRVQASEQSEVILIEMAK